MWLEEEMQLQVRPVAMVDPLVRVVHMFILALEALEDPVVAELEQVLEQLEALEDLVVLVALASVDIVIILRMDMEAVIVDPVDTMAAMHQPIWVFCMCWGRFLSRHTVVLLEAAEAVVLIITPLFI